MVCMDKNIGIRALFLGAMCLNFDCSKILEIHGFYGQRGLLGDLMACNMQEVRLNFTKLSVFS